MSNQYKNHPKWKKTVEDKPKMSKEQIETRIRVLNAGIEVLDEERDIDAINSLNKEIEQLRKSLPRFNGPIWWHWIIEKCPKCDFNISQRPIADEVGEDVCLFDEIRNYNDDQRSGETDYKCDQGHRLIAVYRHAIADSNCVELKSGKSEKRPLVDGQDQGTYLSEDEYIDLLKDAQAKVMANE